MILLLFIVLLAVGFIIISLGFAVDVPVYTLTGFAFIFLLSVTLFSGGITYQTGERVTMIFDETSVNNLTQVSTYNYTAFNDSTSHTIGFYLAASSILGFAVSVASLRSARGMNG